MMLISAGPIVRIAPNEVSINDPEIHNSVLYCQGPTFMKVGLAPHRKSDSKRNTYVSQGTVLL
jgi:hypothetical protein